MGSVDYISGQILADLSILAQKVWFISPAYHVAPDVCQIM